MTKCSINQASATLGSVVIMTGILATQYMAQPYPKQHENIDFSALNNCYRQKSNSSTFDPYQNYLTGKYDQSNVNFETAISNFYTRLLANQKPLGEEFTKILYDNLWDLYDES